MHPGTTVVVRCDKKYIGEGGSSSGPVVKYGAIAYGKANRSYVKKGDVRGMRERCVLACIALDPPGNSIESLHASSSPLGHSRRLTRHDGSWD